MPRLLELTVDSAWLATSPDGLPRFAGSALSALKTGHAEDADVTLHDDGGVGVSGTATLSGGAWVIAALLEIGLHALSAAKRRDRHALTVATREGWFYLVELTAVRDAPMNLRVRIGAPYRRVARETPVAQGVAIISALMMGGCAVIVGAAKQDFGEGLSMFLFSAVAWGLCYGLYLFLRAAWRRVFGEGKAPLAARVPPPPDTARDEALLRELLRRAPVAAS